jgi:hypothetical protein
VDLIFVHQKKFLTTPVTIPIPILGAQKSHRWVLSLKKYKDCEMQLRQQTKR